MSTEPTVISRAEANERIATFFEPKPKFIDETVDLSEGHYWILQSRPLVNDKPNWRYLARLDYTRNVTNAHKLAMALEECEKTDWVTYLKFRGSLGDFAEDFARPDVAEIICAAFLYAVEGVRYEIED